MLLYTCSYNSQMRVQLCGTELHFITLTHMLITIYSFDFSCLNRIQKKTAFLHPLCLIACLPTSYIVTTYVLSAQLLPKNWPIWSTCTDWLTAEWPLVYPGFSISSKFQMKSDGSYWLEMLNFIISNWSKVTILNTLNPLVPTYVTLLPLSQPVWTPTCVILGCLNGQAWLIWDPSSKI